MQHCAAGWRGAFVTTTYEKEYQPMRKKYIKGSLEAFRAYLKSRDMKPSTIAKYTRDVRKFLAFIQGGTLDHDAVTGYREYLLAHYRDTSIN